MGFAVSRYEALLEQLAQLDAGEITEGQLLAHMRKKVLKKNQDQYARIVGVSRRTLSEVECDRANVTQEVKNRIYRPLGLRVGLVKIDNSY